MFITRSSSATGLRHEDISTIYSKFHDDTYQELTRNEFLTLWKTIEYDKPALPSTRVSSWTWFMSGRSCMKSFMMASTCQPKESRIHGQFCTSIRQLMQTEFWRWVLRSSSITTSLQSQVWEIIWLFDRVTKRQLLTSSKHWTGQLSTHCYPKDRCEGYISSGTVWADKLTFLLTVY